MTVLRHGERGSLAVGRGVEKRTRLFSTTDFLLRIELLTDELSMQNVLYKGPRPVINTAKALPISAMGIREDRKRKTIFWVSFCILF